MSARLSSSLFEGIFSRGEVAEAVGPRAWLQAMLDAERALAVASGVAADRTLFEAERYDIDSIAQASAQGGNPVIPLVEELRAANPDLHDGATSQDILDTAAMLVAKRGLEAILADAQAAADQCASLAREHRLTPQVGRTLLRQGLARTFGLTAATWMTGIDSALRVMREVPLVAQLGGPVGALSDSDLIAAFADELGLDPPVLPWHTQRLPVALLGNALGLLTGALGKVGLDVVLLAQDELGEVRQRAAGGSSSMGHKRNPVAAIALIACARRMPGLVATLQASMLAEHQRAAGAWHAEWETLSDALRLTGSAADWCKTLLESLEVDEARMRTNLNAAAERHGFSATDGVEAAAGLVARSLEQR